MVRSGRRWSLHALLLRCLLAHRNFALVAIAIGDGVFATDAESLLGELDTRRGLAALVLGEQHETLDALDQCAVEATLSPVDDRGDRKLVLDQAGQHLVEDGIRRKRILVLLIGAQL